MDAKKQAMGIAALGRGNDTMLVHMSPREVGGLQALALAHGGSLTVNPKTGAVEAGFLESILPAVLGGATMYFTGSPWGAALAGGAAKMATTKNAGLMDFGLGALGGYGGAGLFSNIAGMGASAAAGPAAEAAAARFAGIPDLAATDLAGVGGTAAMGGSAPLLPAAGVDLGAQDMARQYMEANGGLPPQPPAAPPTLAGQSIQAAAPSTVTPMPEQSDFMRGLGALTDDPSQLLKTNSAWDKRKMLDAGMAAAPFLAYAMQPNTLNGNYAGAGAPNPGMIRPYSYNQTPNPGWGYPGQPYFVQTMAAGAPYRAAHGGQVPSGGVSNLGHYSDGGQLLDGPGDGLSDSIPATIGGKQPAALAQGEFVVPADTVSALGGGSTKAGAAKLYKMMDRVRKQAHGTTKQIRPVNEKKVMPA